MATWAAFVVVYLSLQCLVSGASSRNWKQTVNNRPIIGVLSQEFPKRINNQYPPKYSSYIAASYVKFLESAGARVVPIRINQTRRYYEKIINSVNGVLFPGGAARFNKTHGYGQAGTILYRLAEEKNLQGDYFPIWGICLGFELLTFITAQQKYILTSCSAENIALPLEFKEGNAEAWRYLCSRGKTSKKCEKKTASKLNGKNEGYLKSRLYGKAPENIITSLKTQNTTINFHKYCVTEKSLKKHGLDTHWNVLTLNHDVNGLQFVSSFEHRQYPFYGLQFHPEKNVFEWSPKSNIPHFAEAILVSQYFGNFLVNEARRNNHHFATSREENQALIYNYAPVYSPDSGFEQVYLFN